MSAGSLTAVGPRRPELTPRAPWTPESIPAAAGPRPSTIVLAILPLVVYWAVLCAVNPRCVHDEVRHFPALIAFAAGDWSWPAELPMLPVYHALGGLALRGLGASLAAARLWNLACGIGVVLVYALLLRRSDRVDRDATLLQFAWHPLLLPFVALVYTDVPALGVLLLALWFQQRQCWVLATLALALACLLRQSNVVWAAFVGVWSAWRCWPPATRDVRSLRAITAECRRIGRAVAPCVIGPLIVTCAMLAVFAAAGRITHGARGYNEPLFSPAQLYLLALLTGLFWLPTWFAEARLVWRQVLVLRTRVGPVLVLAGAVSFLAWAYDNPHPWNEHFDIIRNYPLIYAEMFQSLRWLLAAAVLVTAALAFSFARRQPGRRALALVGLFTLLYLLPQGYAEPRYYLVPMTLSLLFARPTTRLSRLQAAWHLALSGLIATVICVAGNPRGGIW